MKRAIFLMVIYFIFSMIAGFFQAGYLIIRSLLAEPCTERCQMSSHLRWFLLLGLTCCLVRSWWYGFMWHFRCQRACQRIQTSCRGRYFFWRAMVVAFGYSLNCVNEWISLPNIVRAHWTSMVKKCAGICSMHSCRCSIDGRIDVPRSNRRPFFFAKGRARCLPFWFQGFCSDFITWIPLRFLLPFFSDAGLAVLQNRKLVAKYCVLCVNNGLKKCTVFVLIRM